MASVLIHIKVHEADARTAGNECAHATAATRQYHSGAQPQLGPRLPIIPLWGSLLHQGWLNSACYNSSRGRQTGMQNMGMWNPMDRRQNPRKPCGGTRKRRSSPRQRWLGPAAEQRRRQQGDGDQQRLAQHWRGRRSGSHAEEGSVDGRGGD